MLDVAQSIAILIIGLLAIIILLRILVIVHGQTGRVKELEMRMKAMEKMDVDPDTITTTEQKEK